MHEVTWKSGASAPRKGQKSMWASAPEGIAHRFMGKERKTNHPLQPRSGRRMQPTPFEFRQGAGFVLKSKTQKRCS
jgi:hypothetical protein